MDDSKSGYTLLTIIIMGEKIYIDDQLIEDDEEIFYVQRVTSDMRYDAIFKGTEAECENFLDELQIVPEHSYKVE